jgi:hypothetical protein
MPHSIRRAPCARHAAALLVAILGQPAIPLAAQQPTCSQDHPGRQHRLESVAKRGDTRMAWSAAGHATKYAVERYGLQGLVGEPQVVAAAKVLESHLYLRLGNPSAVAAQFVGAGYQHFDRAYSDEAAAALLGFELPTEQGGRSMFYLPPELVDLWVMTEKLQNTGKAYLLNSFFGIPKPLTKQVLDYIVDQEAHVARRLGFNIPREYDFPNQLIEVTIAARRDPSGTRARFSRAVEEAALVERRGGS